MEKIGSYNVYQSSVYQRNRAAENTSAAKTAEAKNAGAAEKAGSKVELSEKAKNLLKELHNTYKDTDFIVADFSSDEEAAAYLSRGTGKYSALLTPDELEKMAADEDYKKENLKVLDDAFTKLDDMKEQLGSKGEDVKRIGISIGKDGAVSFFAELEKSSEKQRERIENQRQAKKEEAAEEKKKEERKKLEEWMKPDEKAVKPGNVRRTTVFGSTVEELAEKIEKVDWNAIKPEDLAAAQGSRFDLTV